MGLFFLIFGVTLIILGISFLAISRFSEVQQPALNERCSVPTEAELVGTERRSTEWRHKIQVTYHGVYAFTAQDGVHYRAENKVGYARPDDVPESVVSIRYNPDNPGEFVLPEEQERIANAQIIPGLRRAGIVMLVLGVPLMVAAAVFWAS